MEDALTRLHRAIDYALLATAGGSADQRGAFYARLAHALTTQGQVNQPSAMSHLPNFAAFRAVLPILVRDGEGRRSLHEVWESPDLIAPAVAALAILYDRTLDPDGRSRLSLRVSRQPRALYGYRLEALDAVPLGRGPDGDDGPRPMAASDWMHVSIVLCGAALSFVKEAGVMRFAPYYLHAEATGTIPAGGEPAPRAHRPFIALVEAAA